MNHDTKTGLVHFDQRELGLLNEPRSPIDYRAMPVLLRKANRLLSGALSGEQAILSDQEFAPVRRPIEVQELVETRAAIEDLKSLVAGIGYAANYVELDELESTQA